MSGPRVSEVSVVPQDEHECEHEHEHEIKNEHKHEIEKVGRAEQHVQTVDNRCIRFHSAHSIEFQNLRCQGLAKG